jgi:pilus assembly protein Flp/PilA
MRRLISEFLTDETGATAIEYSLLAAGIGVAIITAVNGLGTAVNGTFNTISTAIK